MNVQWSFSLSFRLLLISGPCRPRGELFCPTTHSSPWCLASSQTQKQNSQVTIDWNLWICELKQIFSPCNYSEMFLSSNQILTQGDNSHSLIHPSTILNGQNRYQPKFPSLYDIYSHTIKYDSVFKKREILSFVTTWVNLEDIISQAQKDKYHTTLPMCESLKVDLYKNRDKCQLLEAWILEVRGRQGIGGQTM